MEEDKTSSAENNKKSNDWATTCDRFVVFLDIMGFKDLVARNTHGKVYKMLESLMFCKEIAEGVLRNSIYITSFSDSFYLFTKDDTPKSFAIITACTNYIINSAIERSIPIKGAMAQGKISVNRKRNIYFGQPIIDAYMLHEELYYYGLTLHNSIDRYLGNHKVDILVRRLYFELSTPLKCGDVIHNNLNWFGESDQDYGSGLCTKEVENKFCNSISKFRHMTSAGQRRYIDNTVRVFNQLYGKDIK